VGGAYLPDALHSFDGATIAPCGQKGMHSPQPPHRPRSM
jgi:hypothetical protein